MKTCFRQSIAIGFSQPTRLKLTVNENLFQTINCRWLQPTDPEFITKRALAQKPEALSKK
jgi:hypothetical protein